MSAIDVFTAMGLTPIGLVVMFVMVGFGVIVASHFMIKRMDARLTATTEKIASAIHDEGSATRDCLYNVRDKLVEAHAKSDTMNQDAHTAMREKLAHVVAKLNGGK